MRNVLLFLALTASTTAAADTPGAWVAVSNNHTGYNGAAAGTGTACELSRSTGACIASTSHSRAGFSLASHHGTGATYGVQGLGGGKQQLVAIDPDTLAVTGVVGALQDSSGRDHRVAAMSFSGNTLYGISARVEHVGGFNVQVGELVTINASNGAVTVVGDLGIPVYSRGGVVHDGAFQLLNLISRDDRLFNLYAVNLGTGAASLTASTGMIGRSAGLAQSAEGEVLAVIDGAPFGDPVNPSTESHLYSLDTSSAATTHVGSTNLHLLSGFTWVYREPKCAVVMARNVDVKDTATLTTTSCTGGNERVTVCADDSSGIASGASITADLMLGGTLSNQGTHIGNLTENVDTSLFPTIGTPSDPANPDTFPTALDGSSIVTGDGKFQMSGTQQAILPAGNYSVKSFRMSDTASVTVSGPVTIYVSGGVTIEDSAQVNVGGDAGDFRLESHGGQYLVTNDAVFVGDVLAPDAWIRFRGDASAEGRFHGRWMEAYDQSSVVIDACLTD